MAEGLYDARVEDLGGAVAIIHGSCGASRGSDALGLDARSFSVRPVRGDSFAEQPLPDSPASESDLEGLDVWGRFPNDVWLAYGAAHENATEPTRRLLQWTGEAWRELRAPQRKQTLDRCFDWYDGAKLVTQTRSWPHLGLGTPFLFGASTHPAPTFAELNLPHDSHRDFHSDEVEFAMLPNHEVLLLHTTELSSKHQVVVSLARSKAPGQGSVEQLAAAQSVSAHLASGRLNGRPVVVAFGETLAKGVHTAFFHVADATSLTKLPALAPAGSGDELLQAWLAGDRLWVRRGALIWVTNGAQWQKIGSFPTSGALYPSDHGTLWGVDGDGHVLRFDEGGKPRPVPFLDAASRNTLSRVWLKTVGPKDVWAIALTERDEAFVFRSTPMRSILGCD
ncbi:MAG: hypothetical protein QM756_11615 [Polyangiaceae bacterium]